MQLSRDFRELIDCSISRDVRFLIVGGDAVAAHGHPLMTKDLDVWILAEAENAALVIAALGDFGFEDIGLDPTALAAPGRMLQLGRPPQRVDLLTSIDGVDFETCHAHRLDLTIGSTTIPFIGLDGLVANKLASGRLQDLADAEALRALDEDDDHR